MKTSRERKPREGKSFWETAPGMLTAIAAIITAVGGCVAVMLSSPRLLDMLILPTVAPTHADSLVGTRPLPAALPVAASATNSPREGASLQQAQLPDGSSVMMIDATGNKYQYTISSAQLEPMPPDEYLLRLQVRAWTDSPYGFNFWSDSFRLAIGGMQLAPSNFLDELLARDETKEGLVEFEVNASSKEAILSITAPNDFAGNRKQLRVILP